MDETDSGVQPSSRSHKSLQLCFTGQNPTLRRFDPFSVFLRSAVQLSKEVSSQQNPGEQENRHLNSTATLQSPSAPRSNDMDDGSKNNMAMSSGSEESFESCPEESYNQQLMYSWHILSQDATVDSGMYGPEGQFWEPNYQPAEPSETSWVHYAASHPSMVSSVGMTPPAEMMPHSTMTPLSPILSQSAMIPLQSMSLGSTTMVAHSGITPPPGINTPPGIMTSHGIRTSHGIMTSRGMMSSEMMTSPEMMTTHETMTTPERMMSPGMMTSPDTMTSLMNEVSFSTATPSMTTSPPPCICDTLTHVLHEGCRARWEAEASGGNPFEAQLDYLVDTRYALDAMQQRHSTTSPYQCPLHGVLPDHVQQSRCSFCVNRASNFHSGGVGEGGASVEAGGAPGRVDGATDRKGGASGITFGDFGDEIVGTNEVQSTPVGGVRDLEKETRKIMSKASKKLLKLKQNLQTTLDDMSLKEKQLDVKLKQITKSREEAEKMLCDHVRQLHSVLDQHHNREQELLRQRDRGFLEEALITKTEAKNFEGKMADLQMEVETRLGRIHRQLDVTAANDDDMTMLCRRVQSCISAKPTLQMKQVSYRVEIPQVTTDDIQNVLGRFVVTESNKQASQRQSVPLSQQQSAPKSQQQPASVPQHSAPTSHQKHAAASQQQSAPHPPVGGKQAPPPSPNPKPPQRAPSPAYAPPKWPGFESAPADLGQTSPTTQASGAKTSTKPAPQTKKGDNKAAADAKKAPASAAKAQATGAQSASGKAGGVWDGSLSWFSDTKSKTAPKGSQGLPSSSLGWKDKHSETMASASSLASSTCSSSTSGKKKRTRKKKIMADEVETVAPQPLKPKKITVAPKSSPREFDIRKKEPAGFAPTYNGQLWVVYGGRDPKLDIMDEEGKMIKSEHIGGNAMGAVSFNLEDVLIFCISPRNLKLMDEKLDVKWNYELNITPRAIGVGNTGIAVADTTVLYWIALNGEKNQWIVPQKDSKLKKLCSCDVIILQGREIICVADRDGQMVYFYEKLESGKFAALPPFSHSLTTSEGKASSFVPVCVSAHPAGFLAVLEASRRSVVIVDIAENKAVSVISKDNLCKGVPSVIAFTVRSDEEGAREPKLWVGSESGRVYLVPLKFVY